MSSVSILRNEIESIVNILKAKHRNNELNEVLTTFMRDLNTFCNSESSFNVRTLQMLHNYLDDLNHGRFEEAQTILDNYVNFNSYYSNKDRLMDVTAQCLLGAVVVAGVIIGAIAATAFLGALLVGPSIALFFAFSFVPPLALLTGILAIPAGICCAFGAAETMAKALRGTSLQLRDDCVSKEQVMTVKTIASKIGSFFKQKQPQTSSAYAKPHDMIEAHTANP